MKRFFQRRLWGPLRKLLLQGLTPEKLAASMGVGLGVAVFPIIGLSTTVGIVVAQAARLNHPTVQLVNYLAYPLQILLLIPFVRLGELLFRAPRLPLNATQILERINADSLGALRLFWSSAWHAVVAWALVVPLVMVLATVALTPVLRHLDRKIHERAQGRA